MQGRIAILPWSVAQTDYSTSTYGIWKATSAQIPPNYYSTLRMVPKEKKKTPQAIQMNSFG